MRGNRVSADQRGVGKPSFAAASFARAKARVAIGKMADKASLLKAMKPCEPLKESWLELAWRTSSGMI